MLPPLWWECFIDEACWMANLKKYDPRLDALVMETRTAWDADVGELPDEDKLWLSHELHSTPQDATTILYERSHTGFTRTITCTPADIERLYQQKMGG